MNIAKKLACLMLAFTMTLSHVPMVSFAKTVEKAVNSDDFYFEDSTITVTSRDGFDLNDYLVNDVSGMVSFDVIDGSVIKVDENGLVTIEGSGGPVTVTARAEVEMDEENKNTSTASEATSSTVLYKYVASMKIKVQLPSSGGGSSGGGGGGGGGGGSSGLRSVANGGSFTSPSGATVTTNTTYLGMGSKLITGSITLGGKTITVQDKVSALPDGSSQRLYSISGDMSGLTFNGAGVISEDGNSIKTPDGRTFMVTYAMMRIITDVTGAVTGCFLNPDTGEPIAFGEDTFIYQLGIDGQMHAHLINPQGYFYTGTVQMNGCTYVFNEEGVMQSYS